MKRSLEDVKGYKEWSLIKKIDKGWSSDEKYYIEDTSGKKFVLRINDVKMIESKKKEYEIIKKYNELDIPMSKAEEFGVCNNGKNVYMILSWIEGCDLKEVLPSLRHDEQYILGVKAGEILNKIHSIQVVKDDIHTKTKRDKKIKQLGDYIASGVRIPNDEFIIEYIKDNIESICTVPPVYEHGDFHPGNILYTPDGELGIIDFNRWEVGDPYEEFYKLESFGVEVSIPYCIGQIDGYFNNNAPIEFWKALSVYVAHASLYSIKWAERFSQNQVDGMVKRCYKALEDYDNFKVIIPKWYKKNFKETLK